MVKERVGKLTLCISCLFLSIIFSATVKANTKTIGNFDYSYKINDDGNIWVTNILPLKGKDVSVLKIPSHIDEKKIVKLGNEQDNSDDVPSDNIFGMYRSENDGEIKPLNVSKQVQRIKKIILPKTVTELTPCCLTYIQNGKTINIPQGVKRNILFTYEKKTIWKKFSVSSKNPAYKVMNGVLVSKDGKKLYGVVEKKDKVVIPKKVQKIEMQVLSGIKTKELYIPASVKKIEPTALASKCQIRFHVAAANTHYATKENCIYSKT